MAVRQARFRIAGTTEGKRQGYLCYLRDKPYKLFLKPDVKKSVIRVMAPLKGAGFVCGVFSS